MHYGLKISETMKYIKLITYHTTPLHFVLQSAIRTSHIQWKSTHIIQYNLYKAIL